MIEFSTLDSPCAYLCGYKTRLLYKYIDKCSYELNHALVERGWRRFGRFFSRPQCKDCFKCINLRVDAFNFKHSKSTKRVIKKNTNTKIIIKRPSFSVEKLALHEKHHKFMKDKRNWNYQVTTPRIYNSLFVDGAQDFSYEALYFHDGKLVGVDYFDETYDGLSSIYFFHDPDFRDLNLGKFSIYHEIAFAITKGKRWIYLGYCVDGCVSLEYKKSYKPYEILIDYPNLSQEAIWYEP